MIQVVKENLIDLERIPTAFVSVSLSAALPDAESQSDAQSCADTFLRETGWHPDETSLVAGALLYTQYDYMKRLLMRLISQSYGRETDTSKDYVFTDWEALRAFVSGFVARLKRTTGAVRG
jgi:menaquinone-dependent protoporphyrinogen oxidase